MLHQRSDGVIPRGETESRECGMKQRRIIVSETYQGHRIKGLMHIELHR